MSSETSGQNPSIELQDFGHDKEVAEEEQKKTPDQSELLYKIEDVPPWYISIFLGLQHYLTMFGGTVAVPMLVADRMCISKSNSARGKIISTTFFVSGIASLLQATFGARLPIIQGPSVSFLTPTLAILALPEWDCGQTENSTGNENDTSPDPTEEWQRRMREIQGAIIMASLMEALIGFFGIIGILMRWITPLAIAPTVSLIGLSLFKEAAKSSSQHWGIAFLTFGLLVLFSQYLQNVSVPCPSYSKANGWGIHWFPFFKVFPVLLTFVLSWGFCAILTAADVFPENQEPRTDLNLHSLNESEWFSVPYPLQFGTPTFSVGAIFGMFAGVLASSIESIGDYYACARLSGAPPPPTHAVNRGIFMEGVGCILAGLFGTGSGLTSFSQNIGAIGITKVGSRRVIQFASVMIIFIGTFEMFGAVFNLLPEPILGGIFAAMFSMVSAVGLSSLQYVDLNSSRNMFVLGSSLFLGLCIPQWAKDNLHINTGNSFGDQIISILLNTGMFVGGFVGFFLDNTLPGTDEERGILKWRAQETPGDTEVFASDCYNMPFGMKWIKKWSFMYYLPISPVFDKERLLSKIRSVIDIILRRENKQSSKNVQLTNISYM